MSKEAEKPQQHTVGSGHILSPYRHNPQEQQAAWIASKLDLGGTIYFWGAALALGMDFAFYDAPLLPARGDIGGMQHLLLAIGWSVLSWIRVGWLLMTALNLIAARGA